MQETLTKCLDIVRRNDWVTTHLLKKGELEEASSETLQVTTFIYDHQNQLSLNRYRS
jgi:hypothetical protein